MANESKIVKKGNEEAARICKDLGCKRLFINTRGEYFTEHTYALSSEDGDKTKVKTYKAGAQEKECETSEPKGGKPAEKKDSPKTEKTADEAGEPENKENNE